MQSKVNAAQDPKNRLAIIAAASVCIVIGLSFAVYSLMPGELPGAKLDNPTAPSASSTAAKPIAGTPPVAAPGEPPAAPKFTGKGFDSVGK